MAQLIRLVEEAEVIDPDDADGMPVAARDYGHPVYLRVGTWNPNRPISRNYAIGDWEIGLSVYELDASGAPVVPPDGEWAEVDLRDRLRSDDPKFLVQGAILGWGGNGEPLLDRPVVIGIWRPGS